MSNTWGEEGGSKWRGNRSGGRSGYSPAHDDKSRAPPPGRYPEQSDYPPNYYPDRRPPGPPPADYYSQDYYRPDYPPPHSPREYPKPRSDYPPPPDYRYDPYYPPPPPGHPPREYPPARGRGYPPREGYPSRSGGYPHEPEYYPPPPGHPPHSPRDVDRTGGRGGARAYPEYDPYYNYDYDYNRGPRRGGQGEYYDTRGPEKYSEPPKYTDDQGKEKSPKGAIPKKDKPTPKKIPAEKTSAPGTPAGNLMYDARDVRDQKGYGGKDRRVQWRQKAKKPDDPADDKKVEKPPAQEKGKDNPTPKKPKAEKKNPADDSSPEKSEGGPEVELEMNEPEPGFPVELSRKKKEGGHHDELLDEILDIESELNLAFLKIDLIEDDTDSAVVNVKTEDDAKKLRDLWDKKHS